MSFSEELEFALSITKQAGEIALSYFHADIAISKKSDNSLVTEADKLCEQLIRRSIMKDFPADSILGEEEGETSGKGNKQNTKSRKWIIDPIDGTYNFARQIPIFATLLALEEDNEVVMGVIHNPAVKETLYAEVGKGAFRNGEAIHVSQIAKIEESQFVFGGANRILEEGFWEGFQQLLKATNRQRSFGDYLNFAYVFTGQAEAVLEIGVHPWDLAPMKIIAQEAGGRYFDLKGGESIYTGNCLITNSFLYDDFHRLITDI
jgi:histidinol-phosphatase